MHPSLAELIEFVQGRMDPSSQAEVESHVEACGACCELLRSAPNDTLLEQLIARPRASKTSSAVAAAAPAPASARGQTAAELLAELDRSDILSPEEWALAKAAGREASSAVRLAELLVEQELITPWQSDRLLAKNGSSLVLGKYQLLSLLGSGGMAQVYLAQHTKLKRRVAIKLLPKAKIINGSYLERFHREAQLVAALDHKNIVRAYHADNVGQQHYLVMEYIDGQTLQALVDRDGPLDCELAADYIAQSAEGLAHAAEAGIVHRDIKPANLLLDAEGTIKILDMGLGRLGEESEHSITQKYDDRLIGTTDYMAPEQALDAHGVDPRADIYSLGATLYFLLTGQAPFPEGSVAERLMKHQREEPEPIRSLRPDCPPGLATLCQRMMAKKPDERFQTAGEAATALRKWLEHPHLIEVRPAPAAVLAADEASDEGVSPSNARRIFNLAASLLFGLAATAGVMAARYALVSAPTPEPEPAPVVVTPPVKAQPDPAVVAAKALLVQQGLQFEAPGRWVLKLEVQARALVAQIEKGDAEIARCQGELAAFQQKYREAIAKVEQELARQPKTQSEAQKALPLLPQHHHTFEMALHQARVGLIEAIQKGLTLAGQLEGAYPTAASNPQVKAALATLSDSGQPAELTPQEDVVKLAAKLQGYSERLVREELPLGRQASSLTAELEVGGEKLLVDVHPAATNNQLSDAQIRKLKIEISPAAPRAPLHVGRGKYVSVPEVVLERVTLGPLANTFVRVLVVPAEHAAIRPALSAAFLYGRKCDVDTKAGVLKIVQLRESAP